MALNNPSTAGTERVVITAASSINALTAGTYLLWYRPTSFNASVRRLVTKSISGGGKIFAVQDSSGNLRGFLNRATTSTDYRTNTNPLVVNEWNCIAMTWDHSAGAGEIVNVYRGSRTAAMAEGTYGTQTDGSGAFIDDSGSPLQIGGDATNNGAVGDYGSFAVFNRKLTLAECIDWQWRPRKLAGCVVLQHLGYNGNGTQPDWSGTGNSGAVTSLTLAPHQPLGPAFGLDSYLDRFVAAGAPTFNAAWNNAANTVYQPGAMAA